MPRGGRRRTSKDLGLSGKPKQLCGDEPRPDAAPAAQPPRSEVMDPRQVPQVTITPEGGGCSREIRQEDWDDAADGKLRRNPSNSSISSTGSSAVESEDDLLSDNESKSKGIITLEHLVDTEVSRA